MEAQPYLMFNGRCDEAIEFYRSAIGAEVGMPMRFKDAPDPKMSSPATADKVMHATLRVGRTTFHASDGRCDGSAHFEGFAMSLTVASDAEAEDRYAKLLADGGGEGVGSWELRVGSCELRVASRESRVASGKRVVETLASQI